MLESRFNRDGLRPVTFDAYYSGSTINYQLEAITGYFHRWADDTYEDGDLHKRVVGIIEAESGSVYSVPFDRVTFLIEKSSHVQYIEQIKQTFEGPKDAL